VIFASGMMVYVDMTGQILFIVAPAPREVQASNNTGGSSGNASSRPPSGEHEGGDD
jgi:hypothetical protein